MHDLGAQKGPSGGAPLTGKWAVRVGGLVRKVGGEQKSGALLTEEVRPFALPPSAKFGGANGHEAIVSRDAAKTCNEGAAEGADPGQRVPDLLVLVEEDDLRTKEEGEGDDIDGSKCPHEERDSLKRRANAELDATAGECMEDLLGEEGEDEGLRGRGVNSRAIEAVKQERVAVHYS